MKGHIVRCTICGKFTGIYSTWCDSCGRTVCYDCIEVQCPSGEEYCKECGNLCEEAGEVRNESTIS